ncbi:MAG: hypothetical protein GDA45_05030 [Chromatiales bacterium]|nr:hypothetical protein [Chromatiales bacterium]
MAEHTIDKAYVNWLLSTAYSYLAQNMASQAITILELLNALQPNNQQALRMLAYAYLMAERYQSVIEAAANLERLIQVDDEQVAYLLLLRTRALWGLGKGEESQAEFAKYMESVSRFKPISTQPNDR